MDSTNIIPQIQVAQAQKEVTANENFSAASPAMMYARNAETSSGLTWGYIGGRFESTQIANGTLTLTTSATHYIVADRSTGAVSFSTATTNWNNTAGYARLYKVVTTSNVVTSWEDHRQVIALANDAAIPQCIPIAVSDESTALTVGTAKVTFRMPYPFTLTEVRASLTTAQTSGSIFTVDINEGGTSVLSTKLTIDNTERTSKTAATPAVISDTSLADDAEITIDIDQIGTSGAAGLKVYLIGVKA